MHATRRKMQPCPCMLPLLLATLPCAAACSQSICLRGVAVPLDLEGYLFAVRGQAAMWELMQCCLSLASLWWDCRLVTNRVLLPEGSKTCKPGSQMLALMKEAIMPLRRARAACKSSKLSCCDTSGSADCGMPIVMASCAA